MLVGGTDKAARLWDVASGKPIGAPLFARYCRLCQPGVYTRAQASCRCLPEVAALCRAVLPSACPALPVAAGIRLPTPANALPAIAGPCRTWPRLARGSAKVVANLLVRNQAAIDLVFPAAGAKDWPGELVSLLCKSDTPRCKATCRVQSIAKQPFLAQPTLPLCQPASRVANTSLPPKGKHAKYLRPAKARFCHFPNAHAPVAEFVRIRRKRCKRLSRVAQG